MIIAFPNETLFKLAVFYADLALGSPGVLHWNKTDLTVKAKKNLYGESNQQWAKDCLAELEAFLQHKNPFILEVNIEHRHRYGKPAWEQVEGNMWRWVGHEVTLELS